MGTPTRVSIPFGVGEATPDAKWRVRLGKDYAQYLHGLPPTENPQSNTQLVVTTLDGFDVLVWRKADFEKWQTWLLRPANADPTKVREFLWHSQLKGAETDIDIQSRMLLPKVVREALQLPPVPSFRAIYEVGVIRLVLTDRLTAKRDFSVTDPDNLDAFAILHYGRFLSERDAAGGTS